MAKAKTFEIGKLIIFLYLVAFPFGQLLRFSTGVLGRVVVIQPIDIIAFVSLIYWGIGGLKHLGKLGSWGVFLLSNIFSLVLSLSYFETKEIFIGLLYFLRLLAHSSLFFVTYQQVLKDFKFKDLIYQSLIAVSGFTAIFGWFQYFFYPDLTSLKFINWDDHLFRLIGSFLDPGFTSIILVFGSLLALSLYLGRKSKVSLYVFAFLAVSLAFTYSRAGYLAFLAGLAVIFLKSKKNLLFMSILGIFGLLVFMLPRPEGEGVKLERTRSVINRYESYLGTVVLVKKVPLFGFGYNNLCSAKLKYLSSGEPQSHSCSGADSSILFLLATTGVVGTIFFVFFVFRLILLLPSKYIGVGIKASIAALLVHSQFTNSLFYPWVVGFLALSLAPFAGRLISSKKQ